jgi:hypothetical protein
VLTATKPKSENTFFGIDVSTNRGETPILLEEKQARLAGRVMVHGPAHSAIPRVLQTIPLPSASNSISRIES